MEFAAAKRPRLGDKDQQLQVLTEQLETLVGRLANEPSPAIAATLQAIRAVVPMKPMIQGFHPDVAKTLAKSLSQTQNMDHRIGIVSKTIFAQVLTGLTSLEGRLKVAREALLTATQVSTIASYGASNGTTDWSAIQDDLLERVQG